MKVEIRKCPRCMSDMESNICSVCELNISKLSVPPFVLMYNTILNGRYLVGLPMGEGGFGITYIGVDLLLETKVAIKEYFPKGYSSRNNTCSNHVFKSVSADREVNWHEGLNNFFNEARKMAKVKYVTNTVSVIDVFQENNTAYIVMDYIDGITLKNYVKNKGVLPVKEVSRLFLPLLKGLSAIHMQGIIHRDISPDNIMIKRDGTLCLLDMGASKDLRKNDGKSSQLVVKKGYSPIEQYLGGSGSTGTYSDVYSICATMLYVATGKNIPAAPDRAYNDEFDIRDYYPEESLNGARFSQEEKNFFKAIQYGLICSYKKRLQTISEVVAILEGNTNVSPREQESVSTEKLNKVEAVAEPKAESVVEHKSYSKEEPKAETVAVIKKYADDTSNIEKNTDSYITDKNDSNKKYFIIGAVIIVVLIIIILFLG